MSDKNSATLQSLLRYSLPLGASIAAGDPETTVNWAVTIRAQPPVFPDIYGGELALVSMDVLRSFDSRLTLENVLRQLAAVGVSAVLATGAADDDTLHAAQFCRVALLTVPDDTSLTTVERAVNALILNQSARLTERAIEIQRQLTRLAAENRDLPSLLQVMSRSTGKPLVVHDRAGAMIAQVMPYTGRRRPVAREQSRAQLGDFQSWLEVDAPSTPGSISASPLGFTTVLQVEKRVAGYLSLVDSAPSLDEFDRLVLTYGADVCAIEMAKNRAIASAVEQTRGDWIQMWLGGAPADDDMLRARAQQAGFADDSPYAVAVYRASSLNGQSQPLAALMSLARDDMSRRQIKGAIGSYVDTIVALYPLDDADGGYALSRLRAEVESVRAQLAARVPRGQVAAGISRAASGLSALRENYREAKDAIGIADELAERETTTCYGDLKLYQLLLALKERNLAQLQQFHGDALGPLLEHDRKKRSELLRTLSGFFAANGNLARAAQDLDVHRNTLVYRLERIAELTELDLDDADNRLILHLALKAQRVLATISE